MKKIFLSILTFFYLAVSSGVAMEIHYCMGKRAGVDLYQVAENDKCGRCGMKDKKGGCCNDEHKFYKLSSDAQKQLQSDYNYDLNFSAVVTDFYTFNISLTTKAPATIIHNNSLPDDTRSPIYIRNCNFRI